MLTPEKIKIGCIFDNFYPKLGGGPVQNQMLAEHLSRCPDFSPMVFPLMWAMGLNTLQFNYPVQPIRVYNEFPKDFNRITATILADRLYNILASRKIGDMLKKVDLIHTDLHSSALLGAYYRKKLNKKLVIRFGGNIFRQQERRDEIEDKYHWFKGLFFQLPARYAFQAADAIIVNGRDLKDELIRNGIAEQKIHIVPVGLAIDIFHPPPVGEEILPVAAGQTLRLLFFGRITEANGPLQFLEVVRMLQTRLPQPVTATVIGDGPLLDLMQQTARRQGLPVMFLPSLNHHQLAGQIRKHHFCVFPFRKIGGISSVVTESMACGRIVFATEAGDLRAIIDDSCNGFLVPSDSPQRMADKISIIARNREMQQAVMVNAAETARKNCSWSQITAKYTTVYRKILLM